MSAELAVPWLKPETLNNVVAKLDETNTTLPLFGTSPGGVSFEVMGYDSEEIDIIGEIVDAHEGTWVGADEPSPLVSQGRLAEIRATVAYTRAKHRWTGPEISDFNHWLELKRQKVKGDALMSFEAKLTRNVASVVSKLNARVREKMHGAFVGALRGSYTYEIKGVSRAINYGLGDITLVGEDWGNAAFDIPAAIDQHISDFRANARNEDATHVVCEASIFDFLRANTAFMAFIQNNTGPSNAGLLAYFRTLHMRGYTLPYAPDPYWGLIWTPIQGSRIVPGNTVEVRWDREFLSFVNMNASKPAEPLLEHAVYQGHVLANNQTTAQMDQGGLGKSGDPPEFWLRNSWNGVAVIRDRDMVKTVDLIP